MHKVICIFIVWIDIVQLEIDWQLNRLKLVLVTKLVHIHINLVLFSTVGMCERTLSI